MPRHGLGGAYESFPCFFFAEGFLDGNGLDGIVHRRPCAVGVDIYRVFGGIACFGHGIGHGFCAAPCLRVRSGDVIGVAGSPVPADLAVYPGAAAYCVLVFFQDESHGAFADDESAPAAVKGQGSGIWIIRSGKGLHVDKACHC